MAAHDYVPTEFGTADSIVAGDGRDLFYKQFSGEVAAAYEQLAQFANRVTIRNITMGKSGGFNAFGRVVGERHTPGAMLVGSAVKVGETEILVDNLYVAHTAVYKLWEAMNHYDVRGPLARELARALAREADTNTALTLLVGARATADPRGIKFDDDAVSGDAEGPDFPPGVSPLALDGQDRADGTTAESRAGTGYDVGTDLLYNTSAHTDASTLRTMIWNLRQLFDENDCPLEEEGGWFLGVRPAQYYLLMKGAPIEVDRDFAGRGSVVAAQLPMISGFQIVKSNRLPKSDVTKAADDTGGMAYTVDAAHTVALAWHASGAGTVKLRDVFTESEYSVARKSHLLTAEYAMGHGPLNVSCIGEIVKSFDA